MSAPAPSPEAHLASVWLRVAAGLAPPRALSQWAAEQVAAGDERPEVLRLAMGATAEAAVALGRAEPLIPYPALSAAAQDFFTVLGEALDRGSLDVKRAETSFTSLLHQRVPLPGLEAFVRRFESGRGLVEKGAWGIDDLIECVQTYGQSLGRASSADEDDDDEDDDLDDEADEGSEPGERTR